MAQEFKLTPVPLPVDPPAKRAKKMKDEGSLNDTAVATEDVNMDRASSPESGSDSSDSNSDFSSEDGSSAGHTSDDVARLPLAGGFTTLLANVPKIWPLARLTVH